MQPQRRVTLSRSSVIGCSEPTPLNDPVFFERYDTGFVADRVAELFPFIRQCLSKEAQYGLCELVQGGVCHVCVHGAPKALNRVQMGRVCWQKAQPYPKVWAVQSWLKYLNVVITCVVHEDMKVCLRRVVAVQLFQHLFGCLGVDLLTLNKGELKYLHIKRALYIEALAP